MAAIEVTYNFTTRINRSVQIGDTLYYSTASTTTHPNDTVLSYNNITKAGPIKTVTRTASGGSIVVNQDSVVPMPTDGDFIFFSKEASTNNSHLLGYYAECKFENDSNKEIELFNIAAEIFESSK